MDDWLYDDCRLENNNVIRKGCGYNKSFKYHATLKNKINKNLIQWCDRNCVGKYGWYFKDQRWDMHHIISRSTIFTFEKKIDCFNFKLKQL